MRIGVKRLDLVEESAGGAEMFHTGQDVRLGADQLIRFGEKRRAPPLY